MMIMAAPYACMHVHIYMVYTLHGVYIAFKFAIKSCAIGKLADQGFFYKRNVWCFIEISSSCLLSLCKWPAMLLISRSISTNQYKLLVYRALRWVVHTLYFEWHRVEIKNSSITSTQGTTKVGIMSNDCTTSQADTARATCGVAYRRTRRYGTDLSGLARCTFSARNGVADLIDCRSATQKRCVLVVCQHTEGTCRSRNTCFLRHCASATPISRALQIGTHIQ